MSLRFVLLICLSLIPSIFSSACSAEPAKVESAPAPVVAPVETSLQPELSRGPTIDIKANSPADTVHTFYNHLREKRFRDAIFLTNLRPAIEGLTESELKEFQLDFERIARLVPPRIEINGEIITGNKATVTAKLPNEELEKEEIQEIKLRKERDFWVIMTVDEKAEKKIKQDGKNYFRNLRIETHQDEAKDMLNRVAKAQMAFAAQNGGAYGDMHALVAADLLPQDIRSSASTGYLFNVTTSPDRKTYAASAVPAEYGRTGKRSYTIALDGRGQPHLVTHDNDPKTK
jgi:Tfp pilus assembly protein PilE